MDKDYLSVLCCQIELKLACDKSREFLIEDEIYYKQMNYILSFIKDRSPDIVVFPEMSYSEKFEKSLLKFSQNSLIVFGSIYENGKNETIVFFNQKKIKLEKCYLSGVEPSIRTQENISFTSFKKNHLIGHTFNLKGQKIIVLNCAEYYRTAYYLARDKTINKKLFGFLVPSANNNLDVFMEESVALHNHNDKVYSFVVNSKASYNDKDYAEGGSYIFGAMSKYEREVNNIQTLKNKSNNIVLVDDDPCLIYGEYLINPKTWFYRSDEYKHTPKNLEVIRLNKLN